MNKRVCIAAKIKQASQEQVEKQLAGCDVVWLEELDESSRAAALKGADAVLCAMLTTELSDAEKQMLDTVGIVQTRSAGVDQVNFDRLPDGVNLYSNVGGWAHPMAEHALAMTLACTRLLRPQTEKLRDGVFDAEGFKVKLLEDCSVLIVGWGGIGHAFAKLLAPFGCPISALGRTAPSDPQLTRGWAMRDLHGALAAADIVFLSLPDTNLTHHMIDADALAAMKPDATLVNVARAGLIDHDALLKHLKGHPDFRAALDVWWGERHKYPAEGDELLRLPNVIGTAHNSFISPGAFKLSIASALGNILNYFDGRPTKGRVKIEEYRRKS